MSIVFISDLHLSEQQPEISEKFQQCLTNLPSDTKALYILGDFFEVWIGDDAATPFQLDIAESLKNASKNYPIYFMPGNRDFLLGKTFCAKSGMTYLSDPTVIEIYGVKTLLMHGDSLCTHDKFYQFYRGVVRSRIFKYLFTTLPLSYRNKLANNLRQRSQQGNQHKPVELMDVDDQALRKSLQQHGCTQAIYGHTHRPSIYYYDLDTIPKKVFVLSDWHKQGNTLTFDANGLNILDYF